MAIAASNRDNAITQMGIPSFDAIEVVFEVVSKVRNGAHAVGFSRAVIPIYKSNVNQSDQQVQHFVGDKSVRAWIRNESALF